MSIGSDISIAGALKALWNKMIQSFVDHSGKLAIIWLVLIFTLIVYAKHVPPYPADNPDSLGEWSLTKLVTLRERLKCIDVVQIDRLEVKPEGFGEWKERCVIVNRHYINAFIQDKMRQ